MSDFRKLDLAWQDVDFELEWQEEEITQLQFKEIQHCHLNVLATHHKWLDH